MRLVFIHGWGLDPSLWGGVSALLPEFEQERVDLEYYHPPLVGEANLLSKFGEAYKDRNPSPAKTKDLLRKSKFSLPLPQGERKFLLVGHSLGFAQGLQHYKNWRGWVAVNGFPRFVKDSDAPGCVPPIMLRDIRLRLVKDPQKTLNDFHAFIGAKPPQGTLDPERLRDGLDELKTLDVTALAAELPGLVIASKNDPLVPLKVSQALAKGKKLALHDSGGHMLPQKDPVFCANAIRSFVKTL